MKSACIKFTKANDFVFPQCCMHFKLFPMKLHALLYALKRGVKAACILVCDGSLSVINGSKVSLRMFTYFFYLFFPMKIFLYSVYNAL